MSKRKGQRKPRAAGQNKKWTVGTQAEWFSQYLPEFLDVRLLGETGKINGFMVEFINKVYDEFMAEYPTSLAEQNLTGIGLGGADAHREEGMKTVSQQQIIETKCELTYTSASRTG
jgi:hypothetical protein